MIIKTRLKHIPPIKASCLLLISSMLTIFFQYMFSPFRLTLSTAAGLIGVKTLLPFGSWPRISKMLRMLGLIGDFNRRYGYCLRLPRSCMICLANGVISNPRRLPSSITLHGSGEFLSKQEKIQKSVYSFIKVIC